MSYYSSDFVEQVRQASDIVSLIGEDTVLKGQGDRFMGLCPFPEHSEKTPSFSVSQSKQLYHCFGCQNSGNIFTYLQKQRAMNFKEAVEYLARKEGIPLPKTFSQSKAPSPGLYELAEKVCKFYEQELRKSSPHSPVQKYLKKRAWKRETVQSFRLGYAPGKNALLSFLRDPREQKMAFQLGLLNRSSSGEAYDNFRQRLIFPIVSVRKQVIGFGARALDDNLPKYINSKESPIFHKGRNFYGLNESGRYLNHKSFALIVEGYTDFLSLWQEGFNNLAAVLGTALTPYHARSLKKYVDSVVLIFDGDEAGLRASERSLPILLQAGLVVKFMSLPKGQDPDDFIRSKGREAFQSQMRLAKDLFFYVLQKKSNEIREKGANLLSLTEEIAPLLAVVQDKALYLVYKQRFLDLFGNDARLIEKSLNEKIKQFSKKGSELSSEKTSSSPSPALFLSESLESERLLLVLCLESEDFLREFMDKGLAFLKSPVMITIFQKIKEHYRQDFCNFDKLVHLIMNIVSDPHLSFKSSYPIFSGAGRESQKKIFDDCIRFLTSRKKHSEASLLLAEMKMEKKEDIHNLEKVFQLTKQRLKSESNPKT